MNFLHCFLFQKIIIQKVLRTYLHMCHNHLPEEVAENDCVYFLRNTPGMVPLPNNLAEANEQLPEYLEMGLLNGHSLVMLEQIISQVIFVPMRRDGPLSYNTSSCSFAIVSNQKVCQIHHNRSNQISIYLNVFTVHPNE